MTRHDVSARPDGASGWRANATANGRRPGCVDRRARVRRGGRGPRRWRARSPTRFSGADFEILFVDDASRDGTLDRLRALTGEIPQLRVLAHRFNAGQSRAIRTGVLAARAPIVVTLDGDGQNDPADAPALARALEQAPVGVGLIGGERVSRQDTAAKRWASRIANGVRRRLLNDETTDTGCGLKAMRREAFLRLPYFDHIHRYLPAMMLREGYQVAFHPVSHRPRPGRPLEIHQHRPADGRRFGFDRRVMAALALARPGRGRGGEVRRGSVLAVTPLMIAPVIIYNLFVLTLPGGLKSNVAHASLTRPLLRLTTAGGGAWPISPGDLLLAASLVVLFVELVKSTASRRLTMVNHGLSMLLFAICLAEMPAGAGLRHLDVFPHHTDGAARTSSPASWCAGVGRPCRTYAEVAATPS